MTELTTLGIVHTALALVALACGAWSLVTRRIISPSSSAGRVYLGTTLLTAATALGIFRHGGPGPAHALAVMTLAALAVGATAGLTSLFGGASRAVQTAAFSSTMLFHLVPGVTETLTRLPPGAPFFPSPDAPAIKAVSALLLITAIVGIAFQVRGLRETAK